MNKVSLAWYSVYGGRGYKGPQMEYIVPALKEHLYQCYGLEFSKNIDKSRYRTDHMTLTRIPSRIAYLIKKMQPILHYPTFVQYIAGQKVFGFMFKNKLSKDASNVVYVNCIPSCLVKAAKKSGKIVVVEAGVMNPQYTFDIVSKEKARLGIKTFDIFECKSFREEQLESFEYADRIITISQESYNTFIQYGFDKEKLVLIPMIQTLQRVVLPKKNMPYAFICTATQTILKGTHLLLEAWKKARIQNIPLLIVGEIQGDLQEYINKHGPYTNVVFTGAENILKLYPTYRGVGIMLSLSEGAVRCVPEYLSFGYPAIVSKVSTSNIVVDNYNGFVVDPFDEQNIIDKLLYFSENTDNIDIMGKAALESVKGKSVESYANGVVDLLKSIE